MKKLMLTILLTILLLSSLSLAEPMMMKNGYTAYLGQNNELYLEDPTGTVRVLRYPVAQILSISDTAVFCRAQDGLLLSIALDGSASLIVSSSPTPSEIEAVTAVSPYTLTGTTLTNAAGTVVSRSAAAYATAQENQAAAPTLFLLETGSNGALRLSYRLDGSSVSTQLATVSLPTPILGMTVSDEAVVVVDSDHSVAVVSRLATGTVAYHAAQSTQTQKAALINGTLLRYAPGTSFGWVTEASATLPAMEVVEKSTATPTRQPTPTPTLRPTAKPTATPKPTDEELYPRLKYGQSGTAVRRMQNRLDALGYPVGKIDGVWGDDTQLAVNLFQCAIGYTEHTYATSSMQEKLYSRRAPIYDPYAPLSSGEKGTDVELMQKRLFDLGYLGTNEAEEVDGKYGKRTSAAVKAFQTAAGFPQKDRTGNATADTLMLLFSEEAPVNPNRNPATPPLVEPIYPPTVDPNYPEIIVPSTSTDLVEIISR